MNLRLHKSSRVMTTRSGKKIDFGNPDSSQIDIRDIAWRMSRISADPDAIFEYPLAQRDVLLAEAAFKETADAGFALRALLFDSATAYIGSVSCAAMASSAGLMDCIAHKHDSLRKVIFDAFGLGVECGDMHSAGLLWLRLRVTELRRLRAHVEEEVSAYERVCRDPLPVPISYWGWEKAHDRFLKSFVSFAHAANLPVTPAWKGLA